MSKQLKSEDGITIIGGDNIKVGAMPRMEWLPKQHPQRQWIADACVRLRHKAWKITNLTTI